MSRPPIGWLQLVIAPKNLTSTTADIENFFGLPVGKVTSLGDQPNFIWVAGVMVKMEPYGCTCSGMRCVAIYPSDRYINPYVFSRLGRDYEARSLKRIVQLSKDDILKFATGCPRVGVGAGATAHTVVVVNTRPRGQIGCQRCRSIRLSRRVTLAIPFLPQLAGTAQA